MGRNRQFLEILWHSIIILILSIIFCEDTLPLRFPKWGVTFCSRIRWNMSWDTGNIIEATNDPKCGRPRSVIDPVYKENYYFGCVHDDVYNSIGMPCI